MDYKEKLEATAARIARCGEVDVQNEFVYWICMAITAKSAQVDCCHYPEDEEELNDLKNAYLVYLKIKGEGKNEQ